MLINSSAIIISDCYNFNNYTKLGHICNKSPACEFSVFQVNLKVINSTNYYNNNINYYYLISRRLVKLYLINKYLNNLMPYFMPHEIFMTYFL